MFDSLDIDVVFEDVIADEDPLGVADRATLLPGFDLARFAHDSMADQDCDADLERPTMEISAQSLTALVSKSVPPTCIVGADQFVRLDPSIVLASRPFSPFATHLISLIDGSTPLAAIVLKSGLSHGEAMSALRELYAESAIMMCA